MEWRHDLVLTSHEILRSRGVGEIPRHEMASLEYSIYIPLHHAAVQILRVSAHDTLHEVLPWLRGDTA